MLGRSKSRKTRSRRVDTVIGRTTTIKGDLSFVGSLHIEGTVIGDIKADDGEDAVLVLDENGLVEGSVNVSNVLINGSVDGDICATEHAELMSGARINGNVYYDLLEMAVGSEVNGNLVHRKEETGQVKYLDQFSNAEGVINS